MILRVFQTLFSLLLILNGSDHFFGKSSASAQNAGELRIGVDGTYPPFSHRNLDGDFSGFDIDFANALCQAMKVQCTFVQFEWDNLIAAVRGKKVDGVIASIAINEERRELVDFSIPYLQIPSAVIVRKDSTLSGLESEDLKEARFGVLGSSPHGEYVRTHLPDTNIKPYEKEDDYFIDLANRRLDGVIGNPVLLSYWLQTGDGMACCRMLGTLPHDPQINGEGFGVVVNNEENILLAKVNKAIKAIEKSGIRAKLLRTHLPFLK